MMIEPYHPDEIVKVIEHSQDDYTFNFLEHYIHKHCESHLLFALKLLEKEYRSYLLFESIPKDIHFDYIRLYNGFSPNDSDLENKIHQFIIH